VIICDTGPIFAVADRKDVDHDACVELFTGLRLAGRRLAGAPNGAGGGGHLLSTKLGSFAEVAFLESLVIGSFELVELTPPDVTQIADLAGRYSDLPLGTTYASVIALAERLDIDGIAALDHWHFRIVRPSHVQALTLLPPTAA